MPPISLKIERAEQRRITPAQARREFQAKSIPVHHWSNVAGFQYAAHRHSYHKIIIVDQGSITFHLPELDRSVELKRGDRLELPANLLHSAEVGQQGVACLEAHIQ